MYITKEEVFTLAQQFKAEDRKITVSTIRTALGNRGSFSTISNHLREWRKEEREKSNNVSDEEIPAPIREVGSQMVRAVWKAASDWAQKEIRAIKRLAAEQTKESEEEVKEALQELESLQAKNATLESELSTIRSERDQLTQEAYSHSQVLEQIRGELEGAKSRWAELEKQVHTLSERVVQETARAATAEAQLSRVEKDLDRERSRSQDLSEKLTKEAREAAMYREKVAQLKK
ncbi:DNA-binding protein [Leptolyngbya iicbica]|uniref:DNA-binding protein n=2 Tax=Cyanophyceae TaxID=3028117 RepID=A0A4Q7E6T1_9CYAN|nr:DNA-binding protein [Leptolyngbya sp. LK]RZM77814.1 DNA-binding protein [Leptolyngbya sp. LK]